MAWPRDYIFKNSYANIKAKISEINVLCIKLIKMNATEIIIMHI